MKNTIAEWSIVFLHSLYVLLIQLMGIYWKTFQNFWRVDGDSYASRGMNKLSLVRATYQALPGPVLSGILPLGFSLGLMALHLITLFLSSILCQCLISILLVSQPGHHLSILYLLVFLLQQIFTESIKGTLAKVGS